MALTKILRQECKTCGKIAVEASRTKIGQTVLIKLACGHLITQVSSSSSQKDYETVIFTDGAKPRPYQFDAVRFAEESNFRCIIADEQGLGKTIEASVLFRLHFEKLTPAVIVCPTTVKLQWMHELYRILGFDKKKMPIQVVSSGKEKAMPGFAFYIITFDILKKDDFFDLLPEGTIKSIVIDECQRIKNHLSDRAKAVQRIAKEVEYVIPMSGTPIKNHAGEYFTVLNLVKPTGFPQYQKYIDNYCDSYNNGWGQKVGGLKNMERFHEDTKDIIIRRTKNEVLRDLPSLDRKFHHVELDRKLNKEYGKLMDELDELFYSEDSFERNSNMIAIMSRLRHVTGLSKVKEVVDFSVEFLSSTERKLVVFIHHQDVMGMIEVLLNDKIKEEFNGEIGKVRVLHSGLNGDDRARLVKEFKEDAKSRVLVASTLAAGEGLNLQFCSDAVILERQWNPANEEQAEARFHRFGQENNVSITYMLASGTIDEYFTELVEVKRSIVAATMDKKEIAWDQQSLMKELAEVLLTKGRKAWSL
jgi:SWI/SNF-related matrix-associated actin-dependent regulator 1 of chromatin subfamily A